jgi:hypothetical protein
VVELVVDLVLQVLQAQKDPQAHRAQQVLIQQFQALKAQKAKDLIIVDYQSPAWNIIKTM